MTVVRLGLHWHSYQTEKEIEREKPWRRRKEESEAGLVIKLNETGNRLEPIPAEENWGRRVDVTEVIGGGNECRGSCSTH